MDSITRSKMKRMLILLALLAIAATPPVSEFKRHTALEKEIRGDWIAAEYYMAQPPPELQQPIKSISFQASSIVKWEYVQDGKMHKATGCYGIYSFPKSQKMPSGQPSLIVSPTSYLEPVLYGNPLLILSDIELDFDSRFIQSWGRLIKARSDDGKRLLFIRKNQ